MPDWRFCGVWGGLIDSPNNKNKDACNVLSRAATVFRRGHIKEDQDEDVWALWLGAARL